MVERIAAALKDGRIGIYDLESGDRFYLNGHKEYVFSVVFHPHAGYLASAGADRKVILWNLQTREPVFTRSGHNGEFTGTAYAVAFSPDGDYLAAPSSEDTVTIWSVPDGRAELEPRWSLSISRQHRLQSGWPEFGDRRFWYSRHDLGHRNGHRAAHAQRTHGPGRRRRVQSRREVCGVGELRSAGQDMECRDG